MFTQRSALGEGPAALLHRIVDTMVKLPPEIDKIGARWKARGEIFESRIPLCRRYRFQVGRLVRSARVLPQRGRVRAWRVAVRHRGADVIAFVTCTQLVRLVDGRCYSRTGEELMDGTWRWSRTS